MPIRGYSSALRNPNPTIKLANTIELALLGGELLINAEQLSVEALRKIRQTRSSESSNHLNQKVHKFKICHHDFIAEFRIAIELDSATAQVGRKAGNVPGCNEGDTVCPLNVPCPFNVAALVEAYGIGQDLLFASLRVVRGIDAALGWGSRLEFFDGHNCF